MSDYSSNTNNILLKRAIRLLGLKKPGVELSIATGYDRGNISSFINGKKPVPDTFMDKLYENYNITAESLKDAPADHDATDAEESGSKEINKGLAVQYVIQNHDQLLRTDISYNNFIEKLEMKAKIKALSDVITRKNLQL